MFLFFLRPEKLKGRGFPILPRGQGQEIAALVAELRLWFDC